MVFVHIKWQIIAFFFVGSTRREQSAAAALTVYQRDLHCDRVLWNQEKFRRCDSVGMLFGGGEKLSGESMAVVFG